MFRFTLLIAVSLSVLLAACGSDGGDMGGADASPTGTSVDTTATATQPEASPTATSGTSPTAASEPSPTASQPATPAANTGEPYQLVDTWGEPALLVEPADVAVMPDGGLVVADRMRGRLVLIDQNGTPSGLWDGSSRGQVAVDGTGAIYAPNDREPGLVKLDSDGNTIGTLDLGSREVNFHLSDLAADVNGYVYAVSGEPRSGSSTPPPFRGVYVFDPSGERVAEWAAPLAYHPHAVAAGPNGTVYVSAIVKEADHSVVEDDVLVRIERDTYNPNNWIESQIELPGGTTIGALAATPDGQLYILETTDDPSGAPAPATVIRLDQTGNVVAEWTIDGFTGSSYSSANGIAAAPDGGLYLADERNHRILKLDGEGNVQAEYRGGGPGTLSVPTGIEVGPDGQVYVLDNALQQVTSFQPNGEIAGSVTIPGEYRGVDAVFPPDLAVGADGTIWISQNQPPRVAAIAPNGEIVQAWERFMVDQPDDFPLQLQPDSIAVTADNTILVAVARGPVILEFSPDEELLNERWLSEEVGRQFLTVTVVGTERYLLATLVDETGNNAAVEVQRLRDDGAIDIIANIPLQDAAGDYMAFFPADIAVDSAGNIFLADLLGRQILKLGPDGEELARWSLEGDIDRPGRMLSLAVDRNGLVYVADAELQQVSVYAPAD